MINDEEAIIFIDDSHGQAFRRSCSWMRSEIHFDIRDDIISAMTRGAAARFTIAFITIVPDGATL